MFDTLVESNKRGRRDIRGTMLGMFTSTTLQVALVMGAVLATMETPWIEPVAVGTRFVLFPPEPDIREPAERRPAVAPLTLKRFGFRTPDLPQEIPHEIPPIDFGEAFEPRNYSGRGVPGGTFDGLTWGPGSPGSLSTVFETGVVDELPERISCPSLEYPSMMRQANIEGDVLLQFVIGTDGHVEEESIEVLRSSHRAFERPAREMLSRCLFRVGRVRANSVRVLVQLPVVFALTGGRS